MTTCLKELFIRFTVHVFHERYLNCVCVYRFAFDGGVWDLILLYTYQRYIF